MRAQEVCGDELQLLWHRITKAREFRSAKKQRTTVASNDSKSAANTAACAPKETQTINSVAGTMQHSITSSSSPTNTSAASEQEPLVTHSQPVPSVPNTDPAEQHSDQLQLSTAASPVIQQPTPASSAATDTSGTGGHSHSCLPASHSHDNKKGVQEHCAENLVPQSMRPLVNNLNRC